MLLSIVIPVQSYGPMSGASSGVEIEIHQRLDRLEKLTEISLKV
jgi:hypothetical protein